MKLRMTFTVDAHVRRALGHTYGRGPATRAEIERYIDMTVEAAIAQLCADMEQADAESDDEP